MSHRKLADTAAAVVSALLMFSFLGWLVSVISSGLKDVSEHVVRFFCEERQSAPEAEPRSEDEDG